MVGHDIQSMQVHNYLGKLVRITAGSYHAGSYHADHVKAARLADAVNAVPAALECLDHVELPEQPGGAILIAHQQIPNLSAAYSGSTPAALATLVHLTICSLI